MHQYMYFQKSFFFLLLVSENTCEVPHNDKIQTESRPPKSKTRAKSKKKTTKSTAEVNQLR